MKPKKRKEHPPHKAREITNLMSGQHIGWSIYPDQIPAMVEQMAKALWDNLEDAASDVLAPRRWRGRSCCEQDISYHLRAAAQALAAIGIKEPKP